MENLENLFEKIPVEIARSLDAMSKTNDSQERKLQSEIIHNLCVSVSTFVGAMDKMDDDDYFDDDFDEPFPFKMDEPPATLDFKKKGKKGKSKDDMPF